jgi:hypothetical protein
VSDNIEAGRAAWRAYVADLKESQVVEAQLELAQTEKQVMGTKLVGSRRAWEEWRRKATTSDLLKILYSLT